MKTRLLLVFPFLVLLAVYAAPALDAGWLLDDAHALATHARHGQPWGEWTHPTYRWSGGTDGHVWRPLPAFIQHLYALGLGREPAAFRLLNLLVHAGVVAAAMAAARAWGASRAVFIAVGFVLVLHPVVPEVVGWSSDLFDSTLALVLVLAAWRARATAGAAQRGVEAFALTLVACLCKESAATVAPALAMLAWVAAGPRAAVSVGVGSGLGAAAFLLLHGVVTGQGYGDSTSSVASIVRAGLDAVGSLPTLPARATGTHLFDPDALGAAPVGLLVLAGFAGVAVALRRRPVALLQWGAAVIGALALLVPAAVGIPYIGVQASRYIYVPLVWLVVVGAAPLAAAAGARKTWAVVFGLVLLSWAPRTASRVWESRDDRTYFDAEGAVEPDNGYIRVRLARLDYATGTDRRGALARWAAGIAALPPAARIPDRDTERWDLAQAAFLGGEPGLALLQAAALRRGGRPPPAQLGCLEADALDALGRHVEANEAARRCPASTAGATSSPPAPAPDGG